MHARAANSFISQYMRPAFGWHAARTFAKLRLPFPHPMVGRDQWVYRAYLFILDPDKYFDKTVSMAFHMQHITEGEVSLASKLQSMLLSYECVNKSVEENVKSLYDHLQRIATYFGIPYELVEAYEVLFFNVIDRKNDAMFIAHEVYSGTRFVEFQESYFANTSLRDLVRRAGYNHRNVQMTAYLLGIGDKKFISELANRPDREDELAKHFMGNGLIMARANLLNHRSIGLTRATTLLAASRQGGQASSEHPYMNLSESFTAQIYNVRMAGEAGYDRQLRLDAGELIEA